MRCFGFLCKKKSPSPDKSPTPPYIPPDLMRRIASASSPRTRTTMARLTNKYTRGTLPIGLAVTKVGRPMISPLRPPVINRSRAVAKAVPLRYSTDVIDRINPAAYKNNAWRFYTLLTNQILFTNTRNGQPFVIDKKTGVRKPVPARLHVADGPLPRVSPRKTTFHTWQAYTGRAMRERRIAGGQGVRNTKRARINDNVRRFLANTNKTTLNKYSVANLVWWANPVDWMQENGTPYVKSGGKWTRYGSDHSVTKQNIMNNIKLMNSMR